MTIAQRGNSYQATITNKGARYRRQFDSEAAAQQWELEAKLDLLQGRAPRLGEQSKAETGKPRTLRELADFVIPLRWRGTRGEKKQLVNVEMVVRELGPSTALRQIDSFAVSNMVLKFRAAGNSDSTLNKKCSALRVLLDVAREHELIEKLPAIPHYKEVERRGFRVTPEIEAKLLDVLHRLGEHQMADYVVLSVETGMRQGEAIKLRWSDVYPGATAIKLYETKGRQGSQRPPHEPR